MIHDKAHTNVAVLFVELLRGESEKDTLAIPCGQIGGYPNFSFVVDDKSLREFVSELTAVNGAMTGSFLLRPTAFAGRAPYFGKRPISLITGSAFLVWCARPPVRLRP